MSDRTPWRDRATAALVAYFQRHSFPRTALALILVFTGLFGFLVSFALLHLGLSEMWLRYPVAVFASYAVFLCLVRGWAELERNDFRAEEERVVEEILKDQSYPSVEIGSSSCSWLDRLDVPDLGWFDDAEGCLPAIAMGVLLGLCGVVAVSLMNAPSLFAEVFLDAFLVSILYRRLKIAETEHWLGTAIRRTFVMVVITAILLSIGGACLERFAPGAHSIGPAIEKLRHH